MNVAVEKKIQVGFGIALVFLLLVAAAAGWSGQRHLETFRAVDHTHRVLSKLEEVLVDILNTETGARGFAISGDEVFLKPYESGMASVRKSFEDVRRLTRDDPKQQRQLEALRPLLERKLDHVAAMLALRRAGDTEALRQFVSKGEGNQLMSEIRSGLGAMRAEEMLLVQQRTARAQTLTRATLGLAICGSVLALVLVGLASLVVSRDFQQRRQVETALADSETRFRILFEQSPDPCWLINERNLFAACNHAAVQALGYKNREELLATHPAELSPAVQPDGSLSHKKADEMMALAHQSGIHRFEWEHRRVNGQVFPVEVTLAKTQVHGQQMLYAVWRDISARKQTEFLTREQLQLEAFAAAIGKALNSSEELNVMLARCTEAMVTHLDAAFARIWTLNEVEQLLELQASSGLYTHLNGPHGRVPVGKFKIGLIAQERKPHLTNQVVGDPRVGDQEWARREGMVAFAGYPLIAGDRLVGVLAMFARHKLDKFAHRPRHRCRPHRRGHRTQAGGRRNPQAERRPVAASVASRAGQPRTHRVRLRRVTRP
jgi:PAS domain S-box-containing protein